MSNLRTRSQNLNGFFLRNLGESTVGTGTGLGVGVEGVVRFVLPDSVDVVAVSLGEAGGVGEFSGEVKGAD